MYDVYPQSNPAGDIYLPAGDLDGVESLNVSPRVGSITGKLHPTLGQIGTLVRGGTFIGFPAGEDFTTALPDVGDLRFRSTRDAIVFRNAASSANIVGLATSATDDLLIGVSVANDSRASTVYIDPSTAIYAAIAGTNKVVVTTSAMTLQAGVALALPGTVATTGDIRAANAFTLTARNAANTIDHQVLTLTSSDIARLGSSGASGVNGVTLDTATGGTISLRTGNTVRATIGTSGLIIGAGSVISLTGNVAASGEIRAANNTTIIAARNAANSADAAILTFDSSNQLFIGTTPAGGSPVGSIFISAGSGGANIALRTGVTARATITDAGITLGVGLSLTIPDASGVAASTGAIRLANVAGVYARNAANTGDCLILHLSAANQAILGGVGGTGVTGTILDCGGGGTHQIRVAEATKVTTTATDVTLAANVQLVITTAASGIKMGSGAGTPTITSGAGVPAAAEAAGSIFMRTDGAAPNQTLYVRHGDAWYPVSA